ncbi:unnamed protein product [Tilletia controversa]|uniref:Uncharacterized protein n=2 Tax=Tilletia TaxID=13289 RepID=A0A177V3K5_9BASI|nr:hypothetical protein CF336_g580 [Tilletia laevis]KAE8263764.1 hypothetical protein A4X03_0g1438 [Tilletia caries]CAD6913732.1 unnamed protein product [Tilletia controversa]KAE8208620.1 hypothetical protein CF335_g276 [Tilletia laevis]CAD6893224.1 unnamed protein product [Tilletia caries]
MPTVAPTPHVNVPVDKPVHVVFLGGAFWGHARSGVHLSVELCIKSPNLAISFVMSPEFVKKARPQFEAILFDQAPNADVAQDVRRRFQFVSVYPPVNYECQQRYANTPGQAVEEAGVAFVAFWRKIHQEPQELPPPSMLIVDLFADYEREQLKSVSDVPIVFFWSSSLSHFAFYYGSKELNALSGPFQETLDTITDIEELEDAQAQAWSSSSKDVVKMGDVPPLYRHEHTCTQIGALAEIGFLMRCASSSAFKKCDAAIITSGSWIEPEARKHIRSYWDTILQKPTYAVNVRVSPKDRADLALSTKRLQALSPPEKEIISFLDNALATYGPESVLYLSFGTAFAPFTTPWQVDIFIDTLVEYRRPFIFSQASVQPIMNPGLEARIKKAQEAGLCGTASWIPQEAVLHHKALGAFVTHGGWNSFCEGIAAATPMIFWPFAVDQPFNAALFSEGEEPAGWQLYETRGPAVAELTPYVFRDGPRKCGVTGETIPVPTGTPEALRAEFERVLIRQAAAGSEELRKRRMRMEVMRQKFIDSTKAGGETDQAMVDLLQPIGCTFAL